jgi:pimeloyl-ACP methyl ester carboxylesterase
VLAGGESPVIVREDASAVAAGLPSAQVALLEGQRHSGIHAAPELFADAVRGFLELDGR